MMPRATTIGAVANARGEVEVGSGEADMEEGPGEGGVWVKGGGVAVMMHVCSCMCADACVLMYVC